MVARCLKWTVFNKDDLFGEGLAIYPLEQAPALRQVLLAGTVDCANELGAVEADAINVVFLEPHHDVIEEELTDLAASVIGPGFPPRRVCAVVVVEVDPTAIVLAPAIELPKIQVAGTQVVVNYVKDDCNSLLMSALDELLEPQGTPPYAISTEKIWAGL